MDSKNKNEKYGINDRPTMEKQEAASVVSTDMPNKDRFPEKQQYTNTSQTITKADGVGKEEIVVKAVESIRDKVKVRPNSENDLADPKTVGGVGLGSGNTMLRSAAGAVSASMGQDRSRIPYVKGGERPDNRYDRKIADNDFLINNEICEIIDPYFQGTKPLQDSGDEVQGYIGRKQFTQARGKKNAGSRPQSTMYDRSVDFIEHDETVHTTGQVLDSVQKVITTNPITGEEASIVKGGYPITKALPNQDESMEEGYALVDDSPMVKSNYVLKSLKITTSNGRITAIRFNEDRIDAHGTPADMEQANMNWQVDENNVVNSTIRMQTELGRETTDKWSPLGYVINEPYEHNLLVHDMEAMTGAILGTAYRCGNTALAFNFNNKLKKDGASPTVPAVDMFLNGMYYTPSSDTAEGLLNIAGSFQNAIFNKSLFRKGSAAAIIAMFDTTRKYKSKASFANYQKSLKFFLQMADNNLDVLHCKKEYLNALDTAHTFSTVDGSYNPMLPIYATRKISLVNPMSLDFFSKGFDRNKVGSSASTGYDEYGLPVKYAYKYHDLRTVYYWNIGHPIVTGLTRWLLNHEAAFVETFGDNIDVEMPCCFDALYPTLFAYMLCAAAQDIIYVRSQIFRDYLYAGDQSSYIYPDLDSLASLNFKYSSNFTCNDFKNPILLGKLKPASALRLLWPETFTVLKADTTNFNEAEIFMPFYFSEAALKNDYTLNRGFNNDTHQAMSFPEVRHGVNHDYIDYIFSMSERDVRLCLDRLVSLPVTCIKTEDLGLGKHYSYVNVNSGVFEQTPNASQINANMVPQAIRYDQNSDGRILVHYENGTVALANLNKASIYATPRELGFLLGCFRNSSIVTSITVKDDEFTINVGGNVAINGIVDGSSGYTITSYSAKGDGLYNSQVIDRQVALSQKYIKCFADRTDDINGFNMAYVDETGIIPCLSGVLDASGNDMSLSENVKIPSSEVIYGIGSSVASSKSDKVSDIFTLSQYLWPYMNRLTFAINPFENCLHGDTKQSNIDDVANSTSPFVDPLESSFMFGVSGFFASDFTEDVYNRSEHIMQLGQFYVEDDFLKASLITRND